MLCGAGRVALISVMVAAGLPAASVASAEGEASVPGCTVRLVNVDERNVPTFRGECVWSIAPAWVSTALTEPERLDRISSLLKSSQRLADGRIVNVQKTPWPFEDRQSTIAVSDEPLPGGGVLRRYRLADAQAPLAEGAVQASVDEGSWEVARHPSGTRVVLELRYEPGGNLPARIVHSMSPKYIAQGLDELRVNAEKLAREGRALPNVASGPPRE
jgi:hypothetical protein